jgi:uncharacterized protein (TIGR00251 family)
MAKEGLELVSTREGGVRMRVHAQPRSRAASAGVHSVRGGSLVVRLAAAPVDGAANAELVETLASALGIAKRDVVVARGNASRDKTIDIRGLLPDEISQRLAKAVRAGD